MVFSYTMSVLFLSLSMYGMYCFFHDLWRWWLEPGLADMPSGSFLVLVRNLDREIEDIFRYLTVSIEEAGLDWDIVAVDLSSNDLTACILERFASRSDRMQVLVLSSSSKPVGEAMALCRGKVVHVLDLSHRLNTEECMIAIRTLLRQGKREALVKRGTL